MKISKKILANKVRKLEVQNYDMRQKIKKMDKFLTYLDELTTELNHALPDPEYDAKCEENTVAVEESLARHAVRLGLAKPKLKQLDQRVASNKYVCIESTKANLLVGEFGKVTGFDEHFHTNFLVEGDPHEYAAVIEAGYLTLDAGNAWQAKFKRVDDPFEQNSLNERGNLAAELLEIDLGLPSVCETCGSNMQNLHKGE